MPFSKPSTNLLLAFCIYSAFFILLFCLMTSCRKHMAVPSPVSFQVRIDSVRVLGFNHIKVSASYSSGDLSSAVRLGVCWGTAPNPVVGKDTIFQSRPDYNYLDTLISNLDSNTVYHLRAFCIQAKDTIYGADTSIKTGALELTTLQLFSTSNNLEIRQVASLGSAGYLVLSQVDPQFSGFPWSNLTRIDSSGNRLWSMDYDIGEDKQPSILLPVQDGYIFATDSIGYGTNTPVLCKTDLNGKLLWETDLSAGSWSIQRPVQLAPAANSTNIILSVVTKNIVGDTGVVDGPFFQFGVDQNGNMQTTSQLAGANFSELALVTHAAGGGYLGIFSAGPADNPNGIDLELLNTNYSSEWNQTFFRGDRNIIDPIGCLQDDKGNFAVLAWLDGQNADSTWLLGVDGGTGNPIWQTTFPGSLYAMPGDNFPSAFTLGPSGNYYVTGGNFILKTDATGNYDWDFSTVPMKLGTPGAIFVSSGNSITVIGTWPAGMLASGVIDGLFFYKMQEY